MAKTDRHKGQPGEPGKPGDQPSKPGAGAGGAGGRGGEGGTAGFENRSRSETRTNRILGFLAVTVLAIMLMFVNNRTERSLNRLEVAIGEARDAAAASVISAQHTEEILVEAEETRKLGDRNADRLNHLIEELEKHVGIVGEPPFPRNPELENKSVGGGSPQAPSPTPTPSPKQPPGQAPGPPPGKPPSEPPPFVPPNMPQPQPTQVCITTPVGKVCVP